MIFQNESTWKIEDVEVKELIERYGSPIYVYSKNKMLERISVIKDTFEGLDYSIGHACKSNNNIHLLKILNDNGFGMDVVTMGEYLCARAAGVRRSKIVVNGNGKSPEEIDFFLKEKVGFYNIDSEQELEYIYDKYNGEEFKDTVFSIRVNPDVDAKTHPYISTGLKKNKFGIDMKTAEKILKEKKINIRGIHTHIGSSIDTVIPYEKAYSILCELIEKYPYIEYVNLGGGWGIDYKKDGSEFNLEEYKEKVIPLLKKLNKKYLLEIGRFVMGPSALILTKVLYYKKTPFKRFIVVDTNMANFIRPALYQGEHLTLPLINEKREEFIADVVGGLCESGDIIALDRNLPEMKAGEYLAVCDTGAYGYSMASNYNSVFKPAEILVDGSESKIIRRKESIEDLLRNSLDIEK